jgi:hypothetical protein
MGISNFIVLSAAVLVVAVFATRVMNIGRGKPVFLYNLLNLKRTVWSGPALGEGKHTIVFDYKPDEPGLGKSGKGVLSVNGKEVARNSMENGTPITYPEDESFDIGSDTRTGIAMLQHRYEVPFKFTGKLDKLTFNLEPRPPTALGGPRRSWSLWQHRSRIQLTPRTAKRFQPLRTRSRARKNRRQTR